MTAYTVGTVKDIPGIRTFVGVDGGMSDNIRPMLYQAKYEAAGQPLEEPADATVTVAGKHCESSDVLVRDVYSRRREWATSSSPRPRAPTATQWHRTTTATRAPPCCWSTAAGARVLIERETWDDLVAKQRPLEP